MEVAGLKDYQVALMFEDWVPVIRLPRRPRKVVVR